MTVIKTYPKVNRGHFLPDPHGDLSWAEGTMRNGRTFRIEYWHQSYGSYVTLSMSTMDIEDATKQVLKDLLIAEGLIEFDDDKYLNSGFDGVNLTAKKYRDASDNEMWSLTIPVGDEDGTYIRTNIPLQKYLFPDKKMDPYLYVKKAIDAESAEYFIALCEEQGEQETVSMYQGYFINNTSVPIEIMFEILPGALSEIKAGTTVNDLINNQAIGKWISRYTNIPPKGYAAINMRYFEWEFDFSNSRHIFLQTDGEEKHINFNMQKYFIVQDETNCIPVLNKRGYVCLPSFSK